MLEELFAKPVGFFLIVMAIILITPLISERLRLPGIIGIIVGGMLIGPHGFGLLEDNDRIQFLSTIGLVYLMFSAGLEVDIHQFMKVRARALVFGVITFIFPQLMGMGLGYILGLDWLGLILLGGNLVWSACKAKWTRARSSSIGTCWAATTRNTCPRSAARAPSSTSTRATTATT